MIFGDMSKIGEKHIELGQGINVEIKGKQIAIKGQQGQIDFHLPESLSIERQENKLIVNRSDDSKRSKSLHGLYRSLISNAMIGLEKPWEKKLEIVGTGYNVKLDAENLVFKVGYSHPVVFKKVEGINFVVEGNNKITVKGFDKHMVGQTAYKIKMIRKPDIYKGKGIKYEGEVLRIKPGKKAKAAGGAA